MSNSSLPLQNTLENVTPLFFHLTDIRQKNNGVTFSSVFCNGELEFAIIFFMFLWLEITKKRQEVAAAYSTWRRAINATRRFLETRLHRRFCLGAHLYIE